MGALSGAGVDPRVGFPRSAGRSAGDAGDHRTLGRASGHERVFSIDWLKAAGIVTVVWIHAIGVPYTPDALSAATFLCSWAVPGFFFASGFLHYRDRPISSEELRRRLGRILPPYLVASVLALVFRATVLGHDDITLGLAAYSVLTAAAFGIYYYVGVLVLALVTIVPILSRWPRLAGPVTILFLALGVASMLLLDPLYRFGGLFWYQRSPFQWWHYLLVGWMAARAWPALARQPAVRCRILGAAAIAIALGVTATCTTPGVCTPVAPLTIALANYAWIAGFVLLFRDVLPVPAAGWLSGATYPIYLYHLFFVETVLRLAPEASLGWRWVAFAAGLTGCAALVATARKLLGAQARVWIG
jgi:surface polysaccharide O-acyltransferase-like enzyme